MVVAYWKLRRFNLGLIVLLCDFGQVMLTLQASISLSLKGGYKYLTFLGRFIGSNTFKVLNKVTAKLFPSILTIIVIKAIIVDAIILVSIFSFVK